MGPEQAFGTAVRYIQEHIMALSLRQEGILKFIREFSTGNGYPPTIREIGKQVGISSTSVVNYNLDKLEKEGLIERDRTISRGLKLAAAANALSRMVISE